jgi:biotin transporter BioY
VVIHLGGSAQLAILTGNAGAATRYGLIPFLTGDLLKIGIAALLILALGPAVRRRI